MDYKKSFYNLFISPLYKDIWDHAFSALENAL